MYYYLIFIDRVGTFKIYFEFKCKTKIIQLFHTNDYNLYRKHWK